MPTNHRSSDFRRKRVTYSTVTVQVRNWHSTASDSNRISLIRPSRPARILLLDDVDDVRNSIVAILNHCFKDFVIAECSTGDAAWQQIQLTQPDLMISDYTHPGLSVEEIARRITAHRFGFPIVVLSAVAHLPKIRRRLRSISGVLVLEKPFTADDIRTAILRCAFEQPTGSELNPLAPAASPDADQESRRGPKLT